MSAVVEAVAYDSKLHAAKKRLVEIKHVPLSKDEPYKVSLKRNGVFLKGCKSLLEVDAFLMKVDVETLRGKATRGPRRI